VFIGAINSVLRQYLGNVAPTLAGKNLVIGCSGNFTSEGIFTKYAPDAVLHSNDVSFYSCLLGSYLTGKALPYEIVDAEYDWLKDYQADPRAAAASIAVLLDMLPFAKQKNAHQTRLWNAYRQAFPSLVADTCAKWETVNIRLASFSACDVFDHFRRFEGDTNAVFCCYAPTYKGGYERLYKQLDAIVKWDAPTYPMLDDARRAALIAFVQARTYLWYDDRLLPDTDPILQQESGRNKTVYLYSNVLERSAYFGGLKPTQMPPYPLLHAGDALTETSALEIRPLPVSAIAAYKEAFLSKSIKFAMGTWGFGVFLDGRLAGFLEYARGKYGSPDQLYLQADFAVPSCIPRLSKLIAALALSSDVRRKLERLS
jgi:hypothetical protein